MLYIKISILTLLILFAKATCAAEAIVINDEYAKKINSGLTICSNKNYLLSFSDRNIILDDIIRWNSNCDLILQTSKNIIFRKNARIISKGKGSVFLKSGINPQPDEYTSNVIFEDDQPQITVNEGKINIYYNPQKSKEKHKYHNRLYSTYSKKVSAPNISTQLSTYMLINNIEDLQDIVFFLHGKYALSQNIDASQTKKWNGGKGFKSLKYKKRGFSGYFDGNGFAIENLFINFPNEDEIGLFGKCRGFTIDHNAIKNVVLKNFDISGDHYVGSLAGSVINCDLFNITVIEPKIKSRDVAGGLIGTAYQTNSTHITLKNVDYNKIKALENKGLLVGGVGSSSFLLDNLEDHNLEHLLLGNDDGNVELNGELKNTTSPALSALTLTSKDYEPNLDSEFKNMASSLFALTGEW